MSKTTKMRADLCDRELRDLNSRYGDGEVAAVCRELLAHRAAMRECQGDRSTDRARASNIFSDEGLAYYRRSNPGMYPALDAALAELQRHRAAERERAKVPVPISRERLEFLVTEKRWDTTRDLETSALARFALAHLDAAQQPLGSEAPKETAPTNAPPLGTTWIGGCTPPKAVEPGGTWLGDCEPIREKALEDLRRDRALLCRCERDERQRLLDDIAALRAEVERRDEIIACEKQLREDAYPLLDERGAYRAALLATVQNSSEVDTVRRAAMALIGEVLP